MNTGLLIVRVVIGLLVAAHGAQKFGWFSGEGFAASKAIFHRVGHRPAHAMVIVATAVEICAGLGLAVGLLTPLAAAAVFGQMLVASSVFWANGLWNSKKGFELPITFGLMALALGFTGPGRFSLDAAIGWQLMRDWTGWAVLALGVIAAVPMIARSVAAKRQPQ